MHNRLFGFIVVAALAAFFTGRAHGQEPSAADWDARLTDFKGHVQVFSAGDDSRGLPATKGMPLQQGDRIRTGDNSSAELALDGGSLIELSALSDFSLDIVVRSRSNFKLSAGTFLAKIKALLPGQGMQVETPAAVASVRGTEFSVQIDPGAPDETDIGVFDEGKVEVLGRSGSAVTITPGRETHVAKGRAPSTPYALRRLARYRQAMRTVIKKRLDEVRKSWKAMSAEQRRELRGRLESGDHDHAVPEKETQPKPEKEPKPEKVKPKER
jgi:hypothetical protein